MSIKVIVAHTDTIVRMGIVAILGADPQLSVVAQIADGMEALHLCRRARPQLVLLDPHLASCSGLSVARALAMPPKPTATLLVAAPGDAVSAQAALEAGATGYVTTTTSAAEFLDTVHQAARGEQVVRGVPEPHGGAQAPGGGVALRPQELVILRQVARGYPNKEIAALLGISVRTVGAHLAHTFATLGVTNRVAAVDRARRQGWLVIE